MEKRTFRLRVTYGKTGRLAYLSHLEITHALERMIRRSKLPYALSEGFSPHMKVSFGSALGVGIGSTCEIFDVTLRDYVAPAKALEALQESANEALMPIEAKYIDKSAAAASVAYPYSLYVAEFAEDLPDFEIPESITVTRKKKEKHLYVDDYLIDDPIIEANKLHFQLKSGNDGSLRPDILLSKCGLPPVVSLTRTKQSDIEMDTEFEI